MRIHSAFLIGALLCATASAQDRNEPAPGPVEVVVPKRADDYTEGLAFSRQGDMVVGYLLSGDILRVPRHGDPTILASLHLAGEGFMIGLAVDDDDNVYAALWAFADPELNGLWKVTPEGEVSRFSRFPLGTIPNFIVFDDRGHLLVTDSTGAVWFVPRDGGDAQLWVADDLLVAPPPGFFGANGAVLIDGALFVVVSDAGRVVEIPIEDDGSAGTPSLWLQDPALIGADGVTADVRGNLYVVNAYESRILRIDHRTAIEVLVTFAETLPFAVNIELGKGVDVRTAYLTIDGIADVVKVDLGIPGLSRRY